MQNLIEGNRYVFSRAGVWEMEATFIGMEPKRGPFGRSGRGYRISNLNLLRGSQGVRDFFSNPLKHILYMDNGSPDWGWEEVNVDLENK